MSYNSNVHLDPLHIARLPFIEGKVVHLFEEGKQVYPGILFKVSEENYEKASARLKGKDEHVITKGDIVFIMPGSRIPHFKLKDHIKKVGAKVTPDIDQATVFIGTDLVDYNTSYREKNDKSLLWNVQLNGQFAEDPALAMVLIGDRTTEAFMSVGVGYHPITHPDPMCPVLVDREINRANELRTEDSPEPCQFITPAGCEIIYHSIAKNLPIVSEAKIMDQINPVVVIDEDVYKNLCLMLDSKDVKDNATAGEIIANSDINKSIYYLWLLAGDYSNKLQRSRFKNIRLFVQQSQWDNLCNQQEEQFIEHLLEKKLLTTKFYSGLIATAMENTKTNLAHNLFDVVVTYTPKKQYLPYAEPGLKFTFEYNDTTDAMENRDEEEELVEEEEDEI